jgi:hypothetical protein
MIDQLELKAQFFDKRRDLRLSGVVSELLQKYIENPSIIKQNRKQKSLFEMNK